MAITYKQCVTGGFNEPGDPVDTILSLTSFNTSIASAKLNINNKIIF